MPTLIKKLFFACYTLFFLCTNANAAAASHEVKAHTLPIETAERFGELYIHYDDRICPMQTLAIDFTQKLYSARSYKGLTAEQVLTGWIFWGEEWMQEPMIKIKGDELREALQLPGYASASHFYNKDMSSYSISKYIKEHDNGKRDAFHTQVMGIDKKIQLLMSLRRGLLLKIFPCSMGDSIVWYAPTDELPKSIDYKRQQFIQMVFTVLYDAAEDHNYKQMDMIVGKILNYQLKYGGTSLPTADQMRAEHIYNTIPFATWVAYLCIAMGFLTLAYALTRRRRHSSLDGYDSQPAHRPSFTNRLVYVVSTTMMLIAFITLSASEYLRYVISGTLPLDGIYDILLVVAWALMLLTLALGWRWRIIITCGFLMAGLCLLGSVYCYS